jgi:hypothetical protein
MKNKNEIVINELEELHQNPMFRISLGSKELFHSNFLAFLWDCDKQAFLNVINDLLPEGKKINVNELLGKEGLTIYREKENLDLCICHTENNKECIDIVIENKVKSIPYIEQLDEYRQTAAKPQYKNSASVTYILLTLATEFPNKEAIERDWNIITYDQLVKAIKQYYHKNNIEPRLPQYVADYTDFIDKLSALQIVDKFNDEPFHNPAIIEAYHKKKLSDLYLKQRGSYFICMLLNKITEAQQNNRLGKIDIKQGAKSQASGKNVGDNSKNAIIYLASGMNRGKSTITIHIYPKESQSSYALQIEGNQYRHMFIQSGLIAKRNEKIEQHLKNMPFFAQDQLPKLLQKDWQGRKAFNQYKPDCLYKYVTFEKTTGGQMLDIVVEDMIKVLAYLPECEPIAEKVSSL